MKCFSKTLQNLPYFWNTKKSIFFLFVFHFVLYRLIPLKIMQHAMKKNQAIFEVFFWNISKSIFIEFVKSERDDAEKAADGELVLAIDKYWRAIKVVTQSAHQYFQKNHIGDQRDSSEVTFPMNIEFNFEAISYDNHFLISIYYYVMYMYFTCTSTILPSNIS